MVSRILFWTGFGAFGFSSPAAGCGVANSGLFVSIVAHTNRSVTGLATRFYQMGIEMRPFFNKGSLWVYPLYGAVGASFGYWLQGVDETQTKMIQERKVQILEKRARRAQREAEESEATA